MKKTVRSLTSLLLLIAPQTVRAQSPGELEEVIVASTPLPAPVSDTVASVTTLTSEQLQTMAQPSLGETLSSTPGVTSSFFGQAASRPIIRGQSGDRIRILQNGVGVQDVSNSSPDHAVGVEPLQAERIEVVRGPATLLFGPNAIGGVVNVLDNRIPERMPEKDATGALDLRGGTVDALRMAGTKLDAKLADTVALHLDGFYRKADNYRIPGFARTEEKRAEGLPEGFQEEPRDRQPSSFAEADGATIGTSYIFEKGFVGISGNVFNTTYGLPKDEPDVSLNLQQRRLDLRGRLEEPMSQIRQVEARVGIVDYEHRELEGAELGTTFKNSGIDSRIEVTQEPIGGFSGIVGAQYQYSDTSAVGEEAFITPIKNDLLSAFGFQEFDTGSGLILQAGGRVDGSKTRTIGYGGGDETPGREVQTSEVPVSGALSALYKLQQGYSTALSFTHTERAASGIELFANGPHVGTNAYEIGDPPLGKERAIGVELTAKKHHGYVTGFLSGYYNRFNNYISLIPTGQVEDDLPVYLFRGVDADFFGGEAQVALHLFGPVDDDTSQTKAETIVGKRSDAPQNRQMRHLDLISQVDFVRAYDRNGTGDLPRIPPWRILEAVDFRQESFGARAEVQHVFEQEQVAASETPTDSYTLVNLIMTKDMEICDQLTTFFVRANNVFDEEARVHTSFIKENAPLPGRNFMAGMRFTF